MPIQLSDNAKSMNPTNFPAVYAEDIWDKNNKDLQTILDEGLGGGANPLPTPAATDAGKVLEAQADGTWDIGAPNLQIRSMREAEYWNLDQSERDNPAYLYSLQSPVGDYLRYEGEPVGNMFFADTAFPILLYYEENVDSPALVAFMPKRRYPNYWPQDTNMNYEIRYQGKTDVAPIEYNNQIGDAYIGNPHLFNTAAPDNGKDYFVSGLYDEELTTVFADQNTPIGTFALYERSLVIADHSENFVISRGNTFASGDYFLNYPESTEEPKSLRKLYELVEQLQPASITNIARTDFDSLATRDPNTLYLIYSNTGHCKRAHYNGKTYTFSPISWDEGDFDYMFWNARTELPPITTRINLATLAMSGGVSYNKLDFYYNANYPINVGDTVRVYAFGANHEMVVRAGVAQTDNCPYVGNASLWNRNAPNTGENFFFGHLDPVKYDAPIFAKASGMGAPGICGITLIKHQYYSQSDMIQIVESEGILNVMNDVVAGYPDNDDVVSLRRLAKEPISIRGLTQQEYDNLTSEERQKPILYHVDRTGWYYKNREINHRGLRTYSIYTDMIYQVPELNDTLTNNGPHPLTGANKIWFDELYWQDYNPTFTVVIQEDWFDGFEMYQDDTFGYCIGNLSLADATKTDSGETFLITGLNTDNLNAYVADTATPLGEVRIFIESQNLVTNYNETLAITGEGTIYARDFIFSDGFSDWSNTPMISLKQTIDELRASNGPSVELTEGYWNLTQEEKNANTIYVDTSDGGTYYKEQQIGNSLLHDETINYPVYYTTTPYSTAGDTFQLTNTVRNPIFADFEDQDTIGVFVAGRFYDNLVLEDHVYFGKIVGNLGLLSTDWEENDLPFVISHIGEPNMTLQFTGSYAPGIVQLYRTENIIRDWNDGFTFSADGKLFIPQFRPNEKADIIFGGTPENPHNGTSLQQTIEELTNKITELENRLAALEGNP